MRLSLPGLVDGVDARSDLAVQHRSEHHPGTDGDHLDE